MSEIEDNQVQELINAIVEDAVTQNEQFEIPMDAPIKEFGYHLKSHPRTILSAKFGDGKSFFLSKFEEVKKDDYEIITLHPVNYQVVENKDIFELIKRDILFQITVKGMLDENLEISEEAAWAFFIQNNFLGFSESVVSFLSLLQSPPETVSGVLFALKTHKILKDLRKKVLDVKKEYKSTDALEVFINKCEDISVLEDDLVTKIIQDSIDDYKRNHTTKKVVLVIEDMDRLDPAHLFRILNVFSAHLDTNEKYFVKSNGSYFYNKFHFDNVVFVMDFDNTRNIFKHFYGANTNFEGYIEKFVTKGVFAYSLKIEKYLYLINKVVSITGLPKEYVEAVLQPDCFEGKSLRAIVNSFENTDDHFKTVPIYEDKRLHYGILNLYAIMKNLGIEGTKLVSCYRSVLTEKGIDLLPYIIGLFYMTWRWPFRYKILNNKYMLCSNLLVEQYKYYIIVIKGYNYSNNCLDYNIEKMRSLREVCRFFDENHVFDEIKPTLDSAHVIREAIHNNNTNFEDFTKTLDIFVA